jgi:hypothetical protein
MKKKTNLSIKSCLLLKFQQKYMQTPLFIKILIFLSLLFMLKVCKKNLLIDFFFNFSYFKYIFFIN